MVSCLSKMVSAGLTTTTILYSHFHYRVCQTYASVNSSCAQHPPGLLRGICPPRQSRGWGICKFCAARGLGIRQTPGPFLSFWHARGFLSEYNYTAGLGQLELTDPLLDDKKVKWAIHRVFKREYIPDRNQIFSETFDMVMLCSFDITEHQA